jgi:CSLREA domain-containing protein
MNGRIFARIPIQKLCLVVAVTLLASPALAWQPAWHVDSATLTVTTVADELVSPGTGCSLREAIANANNDSSIYPECYTTGSYGDDWIVFDYATTSGIPIVLTGAADDDANASGDLDILDGGSLSILGLGATQTIVDGGGLDRVFHICPGGGCNFIAALSDMTIGHGNAAGGGGIRNEATLVASDVTVGSAGMGNQASDGGGIYTRPGSATTLDDCIVSGNSAIFGGGIYNNGWLMVIDSTIGGAGAPNTASADGGGIYSPSGTVTLDGTTVSANTATNAGGIYNEATLNIENGSTIGGAIGGAGAANEASADGGGLYNMGGTMTVDASTVSANTAADGGGIYNRGMLTIQNGSAIGGAGAANVASGYGGGIYNEMGTTLVNASTVSANTATEGGGIYNETGTTTIHGGTVSANNATDGAGIYNLATLNVQNHSTIGGPGAGNAASNDGGGIYNAPLGTTLVDASTISANTAYQGGGIYTGGEPFDPATVTIQNHSIVGGAGAGNTASFGGGGIYAGSGSTVMVNSSHVSANSADFGGGIYNQATVSVKFGSTIGGAGQGNRARQWGGGIYAYYCKDTTVNGSRILFNSAANGGGVYNHTDAVWATEVTGSCIVGNSDTSFYNRYDTEQNASSNWWGAATGPNTPGADTTEGNVYYAGWLTEPILDCYYRLFLPAVVR